MFKKPNNEPINELIDINCNSRFARIIRPLVFVVFLVIPLLVGLGPKTVSAQSQCDQYAGYFGTCDQRTYDRCNGPYYDGNRAYYDCYASQNSQMCTGKIYCGRLDRPFAGSNPTNVAPTCDAVNKITTCNQTTYDNCTLNYEGDRAYYDCFANQNNQCRGKIYCAPLDRNQNQNQNPAPNPAPSGPQVVSCPTGTIPSQQGQNTVVCVSNTSANENNNRTGDNRNTNNIGPITNTNSNTNTAGAVAYGGAGGSVNISGLQVPQQTIRVVLASGNTGVGTSAGQVIYGVNQLPKTGLPTLAWSVLAFVPAGLLLRKFKTIREDFAKHASFLWDERKFKSEG